MKIHLFSDYTGLIAEGFPLEYKTRVEIVGGVKTGTLSLGSQNFEIKGGEAVLPISAFADKPEINVVVTAKEGGKLRHWLCGKVYRRAANEYAPAEIDGRGALISALGKLDELKTVVNEQAAEIKKLKDRASKKFLGGIE